VFHHLDNKKTVNLSEQTTAFTKLKYDPDDGFQVINDRYGELSVQSTFIDHFLICFTPLGGAIDCSWRYCRLLVIIRF